MRVTVRCAQQVGKSGLWRSGGLSMIVPPSSMWASTEPGRRGQPMDPATAGHSQRAVPSASGLVTRRNAYCWRRLIRRLKVSLSFLAAFGAERAMVP